MVAAEVAAMSSVIPAQARPSRGADSIFPVCLQIGDLEPHCSTLDSGLRRSDGSFPPLPTERGTSPRATKEFIHPWAFAFEIEALMRLAQPAANHYPAGIRGTIIRYALERG